MSSNSVSARQPTFPAPTSSSRRKANWGGSALTFLTFVVAFLMFFPVLWTFLTGFKTEANAVSLPPQIFFQPTLDNYYHALVETNYLSYFVNSAILSVGSTLLAFLLGIPAAFSMALYPTKRTDSVLSWVLSTKMMPLVGVIIPFYVLYKQAVHLFDTRLGMILLYAALNMPLVIWMMRSFFAELPRELTEAAQIDGAGFFKTMIYVILPVAVPGIAATGLICLIFAWNEFFLAVNLTSHSSATLPVYIAGFMTSEGLFWAKMSAAATVAIAPVFLAGWAAQRSLVRGLTMGAVK